MFRDLFLGIVPFIMIAIALLIDHRKLSMLRDFAVENDLPPISANPFKSSSSVAKIKKALPNGPIRTQIRISEIAVALCWGLFVGLLFNASWDHYLAKHFAK